MHLTLEVFFFSTVIKRGPRKEEGAHTTSLIHARAHTRMMERLGVGKRFCSYRCRSCLRVRRHVAAALLRQTEN